MPLSDPSAPATKQDFVLLMERIGGLYQYVDKRFAESEEGLNKRFSESEERFENRITESEEQTRRHFDVVAEHLETEVLGAFRDHVSVNRDRFARTDRRLDRLECHAGIIL